MNIFQGLTIYAEKWSEKGRRGFTAEEKSAVDHAVVVESQYGLSACFYMKSGGQTYIPLSTTSALGLGESIDLDKANLVTLSKSGEADITRVE